MDLTGYEKYLDGQLHDYELPEEELQKSVEQIKEYPKINK
jgi:tryptophan synthase beta chain